MAEEYNEKDLQALWDTIKTKPIEDTNRLLDSHLFIKVYPQIEFLKDIVYELKDRMDRVEVELGILDVPKNPTKFENVNEDVEKILSIKKEAYPSEIADELGVSIKTVIDVLERLEKEKMVEEIK